MNFLDKIHDITFANPEMFWLALVIPVLIGWRWNRKNKDAVFKMSGGRAFEVMKPTFRNRLNVFLYWLPFLPLSLLIIILARPQTSNSWKESTTEGIDIVMALDVSGSMKARDFRPDRLEAAKDVAKDFISQRPNDRIGLVVFAAESFTQCPLTTDHKVLLNLLKNVKSGIIEDGTAIGLGLANAVNRIKDSKAKSKVIILLTDGVNNTGEIAPLTAAEIAKTFGIRVYTIGVGKKGMAPFPVETPFGTQLQQMEVKIDEPTLQEIASTTDGQYFRATNKKKLKEIYQEIDKLEKTKISVQQYSTKYEAFMPLGFLALGIFLLGILLNYGLMKKLF